MNVQNANANIGTRSFCFCLHLLNKVKRTRGCLNNVLSVNLQKFAFGCQPANFIQVDLFWGENLRGWRGDRREM